MRKAILGLVLLAAAWSAAWFALAFVAGRRVDGFIAAEASDGRAWTCPDRRVSGFPVRLVVTCRDPTFAGEAMGQRVDAGVAGLTAALSAWTPLRLVITLTPPFSYKTADNRTAIAGTWRDLDVAVSPVTTPRTLVVHGTDVAVDGRVPQSDEIGGRAATLDVAVAVAPSSSAPTLDVSAKLSGMPVPSLDGLMGGTAPVDATLIGTVTQASVGEARTPAEAMERWRRNGGALAISTLVLARAGASASGSGTLALDAQHRPAGKLDATFAGLGPVLARYGISGDVAALSSLVGAFFGSPRPAHPAAPGSLSLPVTLRDGRVSVGPIGTAVSLAPLY